MNMNWIQMGKIDVKAFISVLWFESEEANRLKPTKPIQIAA